MVVFGSTGWTNSKKKHRSTEAAFICNLTNTITKYIVYKMYDYIT